MKTPTDNSAYGEFPRPGEVRLVRLLPGPIERVWAFLTESDQRARWICGGAVEPRVGGEVVFAMHHKHLAPGETPPAKFAHVQDPGVTFTGRVLHYEPPRRLVYTFGSDDSVVTFELTPQGDQVLLVLTHRTTGPEENAELTNYAAGWHTHLALLLAVLAGRPLPGFWSLHARHEAAYQQQLAGGH